MKATLILYPSCPGAARKPTDYEKRIIEKVPKVIHSCKTYSQYMVASRYVKMAGMALYCDKKPEFINLWNHMMQERMSEILNVKRER
jgi:hypothetical protein